MLEGRGAVSRVQRKSVVGADTLPQTVYRTKWCRCPVVCEISRTRLVWGCTLRMRDRKPASAAGGKPHTCLGYVSLSGGLAYETAQMDRVACMPAVHQISKYRSSKIG